MSSFKPFISTIILFLLISSALYSQEPPVKWGDIPKADLEMTSFPADTNASAIVLCDYGESSFNDELNIVFNRHMRIKILNQKGYDWATHKIVIYSSKNTEMINNIEGITYSLDEQRNILKTPLDEDDIFEEEVSSERTAYKFTLPALKPGCIIEVRYQISSDGFWFMRDWVFQHSEPVRWSEYRIRTPKSISYALLSMGYEEYFCKNLEETTQFFSGTAGNFFHQNIVTCNQYRWIVKNAPAIRDEPFISTLDDYKNKVIVQLSGYAYPGGVKDVLNDWGTLVNELLENESFGEMIDDTRKVEKLSESLTENCKTQKEKIESLYNWVSKSVVCTDKNEMFADQEPNDVIETKKGSNADITFLFLSMLKSLKIEADPVILSTRSNGKIYDIYPMVSQFNYVLSRVKVDSQYCFMDPTDPLRTMELLPFKTLNTRGLVIKENTVQWVGIVSPKFESELAQARLDVNKDGSIKGMCESLFSDYSALYFRKEMKDKEPKEIAEKVFETEKYGLEVDSIEITGLDSLQIDPFLRIWFHSSNYAQTNGDMIYLNPFIIERRTDNPLKLKERKFPIDFGIKTKKKVVYTITIPDSFEVKEISKSKLISPGSSMSFDRKVREEDNQIQIMDKYDIKEIEIKPQNYSSVKQFYTRVIDAQSEQIVLQRKSAPANTSILPEVKAEAGKK